MNASFNSELSVSVIIPVHNGESFIADSISSVLSQSNILEIIIIDDGSVDATTEVVERFKDRVKLIKQTQKGAAAARNLGLALAQGDYIAFLDADDTWTTGKIAFQLAYLKSTPSIDMVFGHIEEYSEIPAGDLPAQNRGIMPGISPITLLTRRDVFGRVGHFSTNWTRGEFIDWYARATELGVKCTVLPEIMARRRVHQTNSGRCEKSQLNDYASVVGAALRRRRANATQQMTTPVVLVIFNRPGLTRQIFEAVRRCRPKNLFVIADGPRTGVISDKSSVTASRKETENIDWPCDVKRLYASENIGIKRSYDEGLAWVFSQCEDAIILEDDCLPSHSFFRFCTELLNNYRENERVMLISGMNVSGNVQARSGASYSFSHYPLTWGWATWKRAWRHYVPTISLDDDAKERAWVLSFFPDRVAADYWHYTFAKNTKDYTHWDIAWARSCFMRSGLAIHPNINMITNIGFGIEATHSRDTRSIFSMLPRSEISFPLRHPAQVLADPATDELVEKKLFSGNLCQLISHVRKSFRSEAANS